MARRPKKKSPIINKREQKAVEALDALAEFEEFQREVLPALRQDIASGLSAEEIYKKYTSYAAARNVTIALTDEDTGRSLTAIRDILDRSQGKAVERKDVRHRMEDAKEEELDSYLMSKLALIEDEETVPPAKKEKQPKSH